jgi:hypothetical protein
MDSKYTKLATFVLHSNGWDNFSEHLDTLITAAYSKIESTTDTDEVWRQLGAIKAYRSIQRLRSDMAKLK